MKTRTDVGGRGKLSEPWHDDARQAVRVLRKGGILLHATDTVWGLACDATNDEAVKRLNALKVRHPEHPCWCLSRTKVTSSNWSTRFQSDLEFNGTPTALPPWSTHSGKGVSDLLKGANGSLAIRCIREEYSAYVIRGLGKPIASTSANLTGGPTPKKAFATSQPS